MKSTTFTTLASFVAVASSAPTLPPVGNLTQGIITVAGGGIPNATSEGSSPLSPYGLTGISALQFLENVEVALYYGAYKNFSGTWNSQTELNKDCGNTSEIILKTAAQEDVHSATLKNLLEENNYPPVPPCNYSFPITTPDDFYAVANIITPANFGSIIGFQQGATSTDPGTIAEASAILAVEARHDAFLRLRVNEVPNPAPFDTGIPPAWGYNVGLQFVVPGSCPREVPLPTYPALNRAQGGNYQEPNGTYPTTMDFSWDDSQAWVAREGNKQKYIAWLNQANQPVFTDLDVTAPGQGSASVPAGLEGVAFVAIMTTQPVTLDDVQGATLAGPLVIHIT